MKFLIMVLCLSSSVSFADSKNNFTTTEVQLTQEGAAQVAKQVQLAAQKLSKNVTVAVVGSQGETILLLKGDGVGPHNTEAARRKAYTSLSTKTPTLLLLRNVKNNPDTVNLAELPELLLLSGGYPLWKNGSVVGAVGIAGGGSPENDDLIASQAGVPLAGISTTK
ncbi:heme-binding protein [Bacteriovorax stolpii]|uniref:Heme-binding protein n=1 Tax=Bacteriovorax stolpii TaxID=960 RepID=A0A2K9NPC4_BACTC|nr:heme-binding protein [Bacteriovorax stolpii]AUN97357.1 heme-binding protein [Bacteriovorax stolpii]TDP52528.1 uncharacterized protein GlcG (DUF336 family) [Bacteriovorax stolpii]